MAANAMDEYSARVADALAEFAVSPAVLAQRGLEICREPTELVTAETDAEGREHLLVPAAAAAWARMVKAAGEDGVVLSIASAFRTLDRQAAIIRGKLERGAAIDQILCVSAPPGYSEHHSGRAVDVCTPGCPPLEPEFEQTEAYEWLSSHANDHGFALSYPRDNQQGYSYEPWHWCFRTIEV
jgi:D-alanyl-D-alanine carboxypeptidase